MRSTKRLINIRGRLVYLEATIEHWPELLGSLPWEDWRGSLTQPGPETFHDMENAGGYEKNCKAVEKWAHKNGIKDMWIWDAAVQTLMNAPAHTGPTRWVYVSPEIPIEPFSLVVGHWIPELLEWSQFKKAVTATFSQRLEEYRRSRIKIWGSNHPRLADQAVWTVLWQRGRSPEWIRRWLCRNKQKAVSALNIQKRIHQFAGAIDLTLRASKTTRKY